MYLSIDISMRGASVVVNITDGSWRPPPYVVENLSSQAQNYECMIRCSLLIAHC